MNFKRNAVILTLLICIFFSISCAAAGDVNDTDMAAYENQEIGDAGDELITAPQDDVISGSDDDFVAYSQNDALSKSKGTFTELQNLIFGAANGTTITLEKDYVYDDGFDTRGIIINKDLTINGNGHTLNGLSKSRILLVMYGVLNHGNKVTLNNIVFKNGYTKLYGGAILNFANLTVKNCNFKNNYANTSAGAVCSVGSLNCKKCNFIKNTANGSAGAVFSLNIEASSNYFAQYFANSSRIDESGLISAMLTDFSLKPLTDHISKCKFSGNVALGRGGGAVYAFTHIKIASSKFTSNRANQVGGAVYGAKDLYIKNSKFAKNYATDYGGAVYFKCHDLSGHYDDKGNWVSDVKFYTNLIEKCSFTKNIVKDRGGAIYGFKFSKMPQVSGANAVKCTFRDNNATSDGNEIYGGTLKKCRFDNTLTLKAVKVKKSAKNLVLTAKLKKGSKVYKNKKLTFTFNRNTYTAKTNSKGIAKVTVGSGAFKNLKVGQTIEYQVTYAKFCDRKTSQVKK